jgi:hypothetical protein
MLRRTGEFTRLVVVCAMLVALRGERQRLRRLPVFGGRSARVGDVTRQCGDHRCDLDQLRLGRCH